MGFDTGRQHFQFPVKLNALCAQHELVKSLAVFRCHRQAGVDIAVDEGIIEDRDVVENAIPCSVQEYGRARAARTLDYDVRKLRSGQPLAFRDGNRVPC